MFKSLYDSYSHWWGDGSIYIYSDPHFEDADMVYLRKNNISDNEQVKSINKVVTNKDTIIFLGDIGNPQYLAAIRGYKVLVMGNHDKGRINYEPYFNEIYEDEIQISPKIILSHAPVFSIPPKLNIHGHDHSLDLKDEYHINVCAEHIGYRPVLLKDIINSGVLSKIKTLNEVTVENAVKEKREKIVR